MLKLVGLRLGPATNSSSSHSVIIWPNDRVPPEYPGLGEYGWDNFTLVSQEEKRRYVDIQLRNPQSGDDYIDHESVWEWPVDLFTGKTDEEFKKAFTDSLVANKQAIILGGNDNSEPHPLRDSHVQMLISSMLERSTKSRREPWGWTLVSGDTRWKRVARFTDDKFYVANENLRSGAPELVDLKITDYCSHGCGWCYQGSTPEGKQAKMSDIRRIANSLKKLGVFEVAIGGGDPTSHPELLSIIELFEDVDIAPNISVRNIDSLSPLISSVITRAKGCVGVSVHTADEMKATWPSDDDKKKEFPYNAIAHIAMGAQPIEEFRAMMQYAGEKYIPVLLLGYKTTGRGASYTPYDYTGWEDSVSSDLIEAERSNLSLCDGDSRRHFILSVDTCFASKNKVTLDKMHIPTYLYDTVEGNRSCYIDAVKMRMGSCSFCEESNMHNLSSAREGLAANIQRIFRNIPIYVPNMWPGK